MVVLTGNGNTNLHFIFVAYISDGFIFLVFFYLLAHFVIRREKMEHKHTYK